MPERRVLVLLVVAVVLIIAGSAGPALAVNDPFTPAEECAPQSEAVGHPALTREQSDQASAPFSANNPGESEGAQGQRPEATDNCANNQP